MFHGYSNVFIWSQTSHMGVGCPNNEHKAKFCTLYHTPNAGLLQKKLITLHN